MILLTCLLMANSLKSQVVDWSRKYGGNSMDLLHTIAQTNDGNYLLIGNSASDDDYIGNYGEDDCLIIKISEEGTTYWYRSYGGSEYDYCSQVVNTNDGGFLLGGNSYSNDGDVGNNNGHNDMWIFKIDQYGNLQWSQTYGGSENDYCNDLLNTNDGGFLLAGSTHISDEINILHSDAWLIKIDSIGNVEWSQTYGGDGNDAFKEIISTTDGGFIVGGHTTSNSNEVGGDYWVVKIDSIGNVEWSQTYGGSNSEVLYEMAQTLNNGFLLVGTSKSNDGDTESNNGDEDYWLLKIDETGNIQWSQNYGGLMTDRPRELKALADGSFVILGSSNSEDGDFANNYGYFDGWVMKVDESGNIEWSQNYGGNQGDNLTSIVQLDDGRFLVGGSSISEDGDIENHIAFADYWLLKIREIQPTITAQAFYDENENGLFDTEEQLLYNLPFTLNPEALYTFNDGVGSFHFFVEEGTYTLEYDETNNDFWQANGINNYTIEVTDSIDTTFYFPMLPVTNFLIQEVDITTSIKRCNQEMNVWLTYSNQSSESTSGYVSLLADELATFVSSTPPVDSIAGDILYWFYDDLHPTHSDQIHLLYQMPGVEFIGEELSFDATIATWDGAGNDNFSNTSELVCAYDPNDKLVTPTGVGEDNYTLFEDSLLNYTIRFQNTGNDTAFNVMITDTLSEQLDIETFQFVTSSHDVSTKINESLRLIEFQFDDIYLPDSNVNEPASHGFIKFKIETNSNLPENTLIENTAHIFFDFNPAIVTNTTQNTMVSEIPTMTSLSSIMERPTFRIYPNPNTGSFTVESKEIIKTIKIYNSIGQLKETKQVGVSSTPIDIQAKAGIYFVAIETEKAIIVEKVLIQP